MKTKTILILGLIALLIVADYTFELNKGFFYLIFLSFFLLINFIDWHNGRKVRLLKKATVFSIRSNDWLTALASWAVLLTLIVQRQESVIVMVICVILVALNAAITMMNEAREDYLIQNGQLIHLPTDEKIELNCIRTIEKLGDKMAIHTDKYSNHLVIDSSKLIEISIDGLIEKLEEHRMMADLTKSA